MPALIFLRPIMPRWIRLLPTSALITIHGKKAANIAWVTDTLGGQRITYQVGYIGGYSSYIGFDKANQNAVVVLQNSFNWSNYIGQAILQIRSRNRPIRQAMSA
jgi:hypothetical protein